MEIVFHKTIIFMTLCHFTQLRNFINIIFSFKDIFFVLYFNSDFLPYYPTFWVLFTILLLLYNYKSIRRSIYYNSRSLCNFPTNCVTFVNLTTPLRETGNHIFDLANVGFHPVPSSFATRRLIIRILYEHETLIRPCPPPTPLEPYGKSFGRHFRVVKRRLIYTQEDYIGIVFH